MLGGTGAGSSSRRPPPASTTGSAGLAGWPTHPVSAAALSASTVGERRRRGRLAVASNHDRAATERRPMTWPALEMHRVTATMLDGKATAGGDQGRAHRARRSLREPRRRRPGSAPCWSATTPARHWYVDGKHKDCAEVGIESIRVDLPADRHPGRGRGGHRRAQRRPGLHRLHRAAAAADRPRRVRACSRAIDPAKDVDGLHPINLGWLVLGEAGAAAVHAASASIELLRRHDVPIAGAEVVVVGRGHHRRPPARPAAHPPQRERHRDAVPHRHPRPGRARPQRPTSSSPRPACPASSPPTWSSPARPCSTWASPGSTARSPATSPTTSGRSPAGCRPTPAGSGPMTRAMLLSNIVDMAEKALG